MLSSSALPKASCNNLGTYLPLLLACLHISDAWVHPSIKISTTPLNAIRIPFLERKERSREQLSEGIAGFYDRSSALWEDVWGEHMHHGYYPTHMPQPKTLSDHRAAQSDMIDKVLDWSAAPSGTFWDGSQAPKEWAPTSVVDVGCGIGGSTRHIAKRFSGSLKRGVGITLSPKQQARATLLSDQAGLLDKAADGGTAAAAAAAAVASGPLSFQVANALAMPFESGSFDLVWSLESGEHMPDKPTFVGELCRVCAPGGRVIVVTWCHRDLKEGEDGLTPKEERLLDRINRCYYLPKWCSVADYKSLMADQGLTGIRSADWTREISAFWPAVIKSSLKPKSIVGLLRSGLTTMRGAVAMFLMVIGYRRGLIVFGLITATKPPKP
mmetsp:Transcript_42065/g.82754  ORF Transcript_42065/g.82754 Transcript_42065/m.82754 type:complete len:383 (-) Transcript_42065:247-1395(-)